jgi:preprotein translocase subunit SecA
MDRLQSLSSNSVESLSDRVLKACCRELKRRAQAETALDDLLIESFALIREASRRTIGLFPFDSQVLAGLVMHEGKIAELPTGEGKTLAAVFPAVLNALTGRGVHILTFNDYLARRDAEWMGPIYRFFDLRVGIVQEGMSAEEKKAAYGSDITYATAKEAGFDYLRDNITRSSSRLIHRPFHFALVDEADSILIDEETGRTFFIWPT